MIFQMLLFFLCFVTFECMWQKRRPQPDDIICATLVTAFYFLICNFTGLDP